MEEGEGTMALDVMRAPCGREALQCSVGEPSVGRLRTRPASRHLETCYEIVMMIGERSCGDCEDVKDVGRQ